MVGVYSTVIVAVSMKQSSLVAPLCDPTASSSGKSSDSAQAAGTLPGSLANEGKGAGNGFETRQTNPAFGGGEWGVPAQYRRQAGRYLQRLAEELGE